MTTAADRDPMVRVTIYALLPADLIGEGRAWATDADLEESIEARLSEVYGDDGGAYVPLVLGVDVEDAGEDEEYAAFSTAAGTTPTETPPPKEDTP